MFLRHNIYGILWALLIFFVCTLPSDKFPEIPTLKYFDKAVHFFLYAQFSLLLVVGFKKQFQYRILRNRSVGNAFIISVLYGILMEILQNFVFTSRSFDVFDIAANFFGTVFGVIMFFIIYGKTTQ